MLPGVQMDAIDLTGPDEPGRVEEVTAAGPGDDLIGLGQPLRDPLTALEEEPQELRELPEGRRGDLQALGGAAARAGPALLHRPDEGGAPERHLRGRAVVAGPEVLGP